MEIKTLELYMVFWYNIIIGGVFMIPRPDYITLIKPYIDVPLVKILVGVRRCGKSTIMDMIKEELTKNGVNQTNIISRKYTDIEYDSAYNAKKMYDDLSDSINGKGRCYLFLDELQEIDGWE